jgi:hypothetical protein
MLNGHLLLYVLIKHTPTTARFPSLFTIFVDCHFIKERAQSPESQA